jgi:hypothetical protein
MEATMLKIALQFLFIVGSVYFAAVKSILMLEEAGSGLQLIPVPARVRRGRHNATNIS